MAVATSVGVFEPGEPDRPPRRTEDQCVGLSAFGIDIDRDDLPALVPGAETVEEVIPEVVHVLEVAGILPHALVRSGRGLHVYLLIERVRFTTHEERTRAKDVWYRLTQLLGGASDRYDLSLVAHGAECPGLWTSPERIGGAAEIVARPEIFFSKTGVDARAGGSHVQHSRLLRLSGRLPPGGVRAPLRARA